MTMSFSGVSTIHLFGYVVKAGGFRPWGAFQRDLSGVTTSDRGPIWTQNLSPTERSQHEHCNAGLLTCGLERGWMR